MRLLCAAIGLSHGLFIGASITVFLSVLDIIPQVGTITGTSQAVRGYSVALLSGISVGAAVELLPITAGLASGVGHALLAVLGLMMGAFTGVFLSALAEVLDAFPSFAYRLKVSRELPWFVIAFAVGKTAGSLLYWLIPTLQP